MRLADFFPAANDATFSVQYVGGHFLNPAIALQNVLSSYPILVVKLTRPTPQAVLPGDTLYR